MINNEMQTGYILTYSGTADIYGQRKTDTPTQKSFQVCMKERSQFSNPNSPLYDDFDYVGITKETGITEDNKILFNNKVYTIKHMLKTPRWTYIWLNENR